MKVSPVSSKIFVLGVFFAKRIFAAAGWTQPLAFEDPENPEISSSKNESQQKIWVKY